MQEDLIKLRTMIKKLEYMGNKLIQMFNSGNPGQFDGDPLFQPKSSPICEFWKPREEGEEEEFFMNFNCGHPKAECDWGDGDSCCIMSCLDEEDCTQLAGQMVNLHSEIHPVVMRAMDLFNKNKNKCVHNTGVTNKDCGNPDSKESWCCCSNCPL